MDDKRSRRRLRLAQLFYWAVFAAGAVHLGLNAKTTFDTVFAVLLGAVSFPLAFVMVWAFGLIVRSVPDEVAERERQRQKSLWGKAAGSPVAPRVEGR